jgi:hypothetical protein
MATEPIYKLFLLKRMTERWLRLSQDERKELTGKLEEGFQAAGGKHIIACASSWSNEAYVGWGVEEYPNFECLREYDAHCMKLDWYSYVDSWSVIGTAHAMADPAEYAVPEPGRVYELFLVQGFREAYEQLSQADRDALWAKENATRADSKLVVLANTYWSNSEHTLFGILMYPGLESLQSHFAGLEEIGWPRYLRARSILGTLWQSEW